MPRPLVAVVGAHLRQGRVTKWRHGAYALPDSYVAALDRAGGRPVILPPLASEDDPVRLLKPFAGLVLAGGGDVDPRCYGPHRHPRTGGIDGARDELELAFARHVVAAGLPTLAICRGIQVLNVALGGTLHQHVPDLALGLDHVGADDATIAHDVDLDEKSLAAAACRAATISGSSHHHQAIDRLADGLREVGRAPDGLIEAVELDPSVVTAESWIVGVQWHPEDTADIDPAQQGLFDALVAAAR